MTNLNIESSSLLLPEWDKYIKNRENKKSLINLISNEFLSISKEFLQEDQAIIMGGGGFSEHKVAKCCKSNHITVFHQLESNIDEGDSRAWLHALCCIEERA